MKKISQYTILGFSVITIFMPTLSFELDRNNPAQIVAYNNRIDQLIEARKKALAGDDIALKEVI